MSFWKQIKQAFCKGVKEARIDALHVGDRETQDLLKRDLSISELKRMISDRAGFSDHEVKLHLFKIYGMKPSERERNEIFDLMRHARPQLFARLPDIIDAAIINGSWKRFFRSQ